MIKIYVYPLDTDRSIFDGLLGIFIQLEVKMEECSYPIREHYSILSLANNLYCIRLNIKILSVID